MPSWACQLHERAGGVENGDRPVVGADHHAIPRGRERVGARRQVDIPPAVQPAHVLVERRDHAAVADPDPHGGRALGPEVERRHVRVR
jgi:hypothetical protein